MSTGVKAALVAVPVVLLLAGGAFVAMRGDTRPTGPKVVDIAPERPTTTTKQPTTTVTQPTRVEPAAPQKVTVKVHSTPDGAAIFREGRQIGTTPTDLLLTRDEVHSLTFKLADYKDAERQLDFSNLAGNEQTVDVTLERKAQPTVRQPKQPKQPTGDNAPMGAFE